MVLSLLFIVFSEFSVWWILPCLGVGLLFGWFFYRKELSQKSNLYYFLFALRTIFISLLCFLLLAPLIKTQRKRTEKPLIVIAQDNSASIKSAGLDLQTYHKQFKLLKERLSEVYEVEVLSFGKSVKLGDTLNYKEQQTNFSALFDFINKQYEGRNLGTVILASDGIINAGYNPITELTKFKSPIFTIALGDTIPKKDLFINSINYNKIAYLGNDYTVAVNLGAFDLKGSKAIVNIKAEGLQPFNKTIVIDEQDWRNALTFSLKATKLGVQKITIEALPVDKEATLQNNKQTIFIDVLDGKKKVLILAHAPHPDLAAIKQSLEANENYEVLVNVVNAQENSIDFDIYSLVILHNLPSAKAPIKAIFNKLKNKPKLFITGLNVDFDELNQTQDLLKTNKGGSAEDFFPKLNTGFFAFSLSATSAGLIAKFPPLNSQISSYTFVVQHQDFLVKPDDQPLLSFVKQNNLTTGFLFGEGLWKWRLENYKLAENHDAFQEILSKVVQYLSVQEDKRKFRAYPVKNRFTDDEAILLNAELYNDVFEPIKNAEIAVDVFSNTGKKYSYIFTAKGENYELNAGLLPAGSYSFTAKTSATGKQEVAKGQFLVEQLVAEYQQTKANHQLLYQMAEATGGDFLYPADLESLNARLQQKEQIKTITFEDKSYDDLINLKWFFAVLMIFITLEWFLRKRNGTI
ncbi:hypothetical protein [Pedobacter glucosidilyticus]|uniref:hypothetical protein n=1 Tax=Pedobacter glucosidilyticus TaxID=1122941 RepID=UPI0026EEFD8A|nr:hypothetical protein [Pedobacter glucosidilyticus]